MKVGIFTDCYYPQINGVVTSIMSLETVLRKLGHEVFIITAAVPNFVDAKPSHVIRIPSIPFFKWTEFRIGIFLKHTKIYNTVKKLRLDIVHTQTEFTMGLFGLLIAKDLRIPSVHTYHTVHEEYTHYVSNIGQNQLKKLVRKLSKKYLTPFSVVIVPTKKTQDLLISYGVKNKIHIVPSGINIEKFNRQDQNHEISAIKNIYNLADEYFKILFLGRISKEKNIDVLINIFPKLLSIYKNIKLIIVGDGPYKIEIEELVRNLGLCENIIFTDRIENEKVPIYYKLANIFVSPSKTETQGLTILEAMAAGTPVLVYNDTNIEGFIFDKKNGLLFNTDDELIEKIQFAIKNKQELIKYAIAGKKSSENFSSFIFAEKIEKIYKDLLN